MLRLTRLSVSFAAVLVAAWTSARAAYAADYHVAPAPTGSDTTGDGSPGKPWATIGHAAAGVAAGDTVHVATGSYGNIVTSVSGTASGRIRFVSDVRWKATVVGSGTESTWSNNGDYVDIVGFDVTGSGRLGILNSGSFVLVAGNHVHDLAVSGGCTSNGGAGIVNADYTKSDDDVIGNVVHDIGVPGACNGVQGIYHANLRGHVENNIVYRVSAFGIHLWHAANAVRIVNNTVFANGSASMGGGIVIGSGDSPGGIVVDNTIVANNIVVNNPASSITEYCYAGVSCIGSTNQILDNLVYGNGSPVSLRVGTDTGTIVASPKFVNYQANGSGDYHLLAGSPAIGAGNSTYAPSTDLDGNPRPPGAVDIGAYQSVSAADAGADASAADAGRDSSVDAEPDGALADADGPSPDATPPANGDSPPAQTGGCGCTTGATGTGSGVFATLAYALLLTRRRGRAPS